jgi:hypothetical protein
LSRIFEGIKNLFPLSKAFQLFTNNDKRKLIKGMSCLPENIRHEMELVYADLFPDTTRFPEEWESVFAVLFKEEELEKRRDILDSLWKINIGGQSAQFMEDILRKVDNNIRVIENIPLRNPRDSNVVQMMVCDAEIAVCDNEKAVCDYRIGDETFIPTILQNDVSGHYSIPNNSRYWEFCVFVCKSVVRNQRNEIMYIEWLEIEQRWQNYIEYLILKIKPRQITAVMFIKWI